MLFICYIDSKQLFDENTGIQISGFNEHSKIHSWQSKCLWYSHKSHQFEEAFFSSKILKIIQSDPVFDCDTKEKSEDEIKIIEEEKRKIIEYDKSLKQTGALVSLKTIDLEAGKRKSFLHQKGNDKVNNKTINALLSFVPPVMQVIGTVKSESKEPLFDLKTNSQKRFISKILVKCKYYNPSSDKFSEVSIPIEALKLIPEIEQEVLEKIQNIISDPKCIIPYGNQILQLKKIYNRFGRYFVEAFDYTIYEFKEIEVNNNVNQFVSYSNEILTFKQINFLTNPLGVIKINNANIEAFTGLDKIPVGNEREEKKKYLYLRLNYNGYRGDNPTKRTIKDWEFVEIVEVTGNEPELYIKAYCYLRNAERHFKVKNIIKLEIIDLTPDNITKQR